MREVRIRRGLIHDAVFYKDLAGEKVKPEEREHRTKPHWRTVIHITEDGLEETFIFPSDRKVEARVLAHRHPVPGSYRTRYSVRR
jgi:hypothetical protein